MVGKMLWIDEFWGLDEMNAGLMQQWLLTADCSTPWQQRQETLSHPVTGTTSAGELDDLRRSGLHSSDLLKLVPEYVYTWTQEHIF